MAAFLLAMVVLLLLALPLYPAVREWASPTDAAPLQVVRTQDSKVDHFAMSFRELVRQQTMPAVVNAQERGTLETGHLTRGEAFLVLPANLPEVPLTPQERSAQEGQRVVVACGKLTLPPTYVMTREVYGLADVEVGARSACRALLADGAIRFGWGSGVLRWAHAGTVLSTAPEARLWGRASAGERIQLAAGTQFSRIHAPIIETDRAGHAANPTTGERPRTPLAFPPQHTRTVGVRRIVRGDFAVPEGTRHDGNLIVQGNLTIGADVLICGSVKCAGHLKSGPGLVVQGSVVSRDSMDIGPHARLGGPLVSEREINLGSGSEVGTLAKPTTVTSSRVVLEPGIRVHGSVWAREEGIVKGRFSEILVAELEALDAR